MTIITLRIASFEFEMTTRPSLYLAVPWIGEVFLSPGSSAANGWGR